MSEFECKCGAIWHVGQKICLRCGRLTPYRMDGMTDEQLVADEEQQHDETDDYNDKEDRIGDENARNTKRDY